MDASIQVSQNIPSDGTLKCATGENQITLDAYSPYPDDYLYGAFYGRTKNYCPPGKHFMLFRDGPYFYRVTWVRT